MRFQFAIATSTFQSLTFYRFPFTLPNGTADHSPLYHDNKPSLFASFYALLMLFPLISYLVFLCTHTTQPLSPFILSSIYSFFLCLPCHMLIPQCFPDAFIVILRTLVQFSTFIVLLYIKTRFFNPK